MRDDDVAAAVAVKFRLRGVTATVTPKAGDGDPFEAQAIRFRLDPDFERASAPGWVIELLASEMPKRPRNGWIVTLAGTAHRVRSARPGPQDKSWLCDVDEVTG